MRQLQAKTSKGKELATDDGGSSAVQEDEDAAVADDEQHVPMDPLADALGERGHGCGHSHGHSHGNAIRHALQRFMSHFCYCQVKQDRCMSFLEEKAGFPPASPLHPF